MDPEVVRILVESAMALGLLGAGGKAAWNRWGMRGNGAGESRISKREARELADAAADRAGKDAHTIAALQALKAAIEAHEHRDTERFEALMARLKELGDRSHDHANKLHRAQADLEHVQDDLRITRRQLGMDSQVIDVRGSR